MKHTNSHCECTNAHMHCMIDFLFPCLNILYIIMIHFWLSQNTETFHAHNRTCEKSLLELSLYRFKTVPRRAAARSIDQVSLQEESEMSHGENLQCFLLQNFFLFTARAKNIACFDTCSLINWSTFPFPWLVWSARSLRHFDVADEPMCPPSLTAFASLVSSSLRVDISIFSEWFSSSSSDFSLIYFVFRRSYSCFQRRLTSINWKNNNFC